jgi:hypothetical protein
VRATGAYTFNSFRTATPKNLSDPKREFEKVETTNEHTLRYVVQSEVKGFFK